MPQCLETPLVKSRPKTSAHWVRGCICLDYCTFLWDMSYYMTHNVYSVMFHRPTCYYSFLGLNAAFLLVYHLFFGAYCEQSIHFSISKGNRC